MKKECWTHILLNFKGNGIRLKHFLGPDALFGERGNSQDTIGTFRVPIEESVWFEDVGTYTKYSMIIRVLIEAWIIWSINIKNCPLKFFRGIRFWRWYLQTWRDRPKASDGCIGRFRLHSCSCYASRECTSHRVMDILKINMNNYLDLWFFFFIKNWM